MKIAIIGAGNIATYYGTCFKQHGHEILQIVAHNETSAVALAQRLACETYATDIQYLTKEAEVYLFAVTDDALLDYAKNITLSDKLVLFAAGAHPCSTFLSMSEDVGCIWCVYSIQKDQLPRHRSIPLVVSGTTKNAKYKAAKLADSISDLVYELSDDQKSVVHLGAVLCNNFTNHLYDITNRVLNKHEISFDILKPIIENTAEKIQHTAPNLLQSGPAIREDNSTMRKHIDLLNDMAQWQNVYQALSESILASK